MDAIGRYALEERIARGGMGEVFRAVAKGAGGFEKPVVIKRILPQLNEDARLGAMFVAEARVMSRLVHPNIVQVLDFGAGVEGDYFLVMELVDGVDLRAFAKAHDGPVEMGLAARIVIEMLRGLRYAHEMALDGGHTVVHRDVSPGNVLLSRAGEVKVADFGVALVSNPLRAEQPSEVAGKLGYMAPEQHRGETVDARADLFATGVVLYRLLTGRLPFEGSDGSSRQAAAGRGDFAAVTTRRPEVPPAIAAVVERALAPDPDDRFASAQQMAVALRRACDEARIRLPEPDDLAEAVRAVAPVRSALVQPAAGQLTRVEGRFTMQVTSTRQGSVIGRGSEVGSVIGAEGPARSGDDGTVEDPSSGGPDAGPGSGRAPKARGMALALGAGLVVLAGIAVSQLRGAAATRSAEASSDVATTTSRQAASAAASSSPVASTSTSETDAAAPMAPVSATTLPVAGRPPVPRPSPPSVPTPEPTVAATTSCVGKVLLAAKGSWWVSGGPSRVQAPGQYAWPCGTYQLSATSRADGRTASSSVTVTREAMAATRFE